MEFYYFSFESYKLSGKEFRRLILGLNAALYIFWLHVSVWLRPPRCVPQAHVCMNRKVGRGLKERTKSFDMDPVDVPALGDTNGVPVNKAAAGGRARLKRPWRAADL